MKPAWLSVSTAVVASVVAAVGCGGGDAGQPATDLTATTVAPVVAVVDEAFLAEQVQRVSIPEFAGAVMVVVADADGNVVYAGEGTDPDGNPPTPDRAFRIASITRCSLR